MNSARNKNRRFIKHKRSIKWVTICVREQALYQLFSLLGSFAIFGKCEHFHGSIFTAVADHFAMNVYVALTLEFTHPFLSFFQGLLKAVRVSPRKICCVGFRVKVLKSMGPSNLQILACVIQLPANRPHTSFPLHAVRRHPIYGSESHLIQLALEAHIPHAKRVLFTTFCALNRKVEP